MLFVNGDSLILKQKEHSIIFVGSVLKIQQIFKQKFLFPKSVLNNHIFFPSLIKIIFVSKKEIWLKISAKNRNQVFLYLNFLES